MTDLISLVSTQLLLVVSRLRVARLTLRMLRTSPKRPMKKQPSMRRPKSAAGVHHIASALY
jgi:hypothetical protein